MIQIQQVLSCICFNELKMSSALFDTYLEASKLLLILSPFFNYRVCSKPTLSGSKLRLKFSTALKLPQNMYYHFYASTVITAHFNSWPLENHGCRPQKLFKHEVAALEACIFLHLGIFVFSVLLQLWSSIRSVLFGTSLLWMRYIWKLMTLVSALFTSCVRYFSCHTTTTGNENYRLYSS